MQLLRFGLALSTLCVAASAQITTVGPFTGDRTEDFEIPNTTPFPPCIDNGVFETLGGNNWAATLCPVSGSAHITTGWGFSCTIFPHSGTRFTASTGGAYVFDFSLGGQDIEQFGGYFGTNAPASSNPNGSWGMSVRFYDANGVQVGPDQVYSWPSNCQWTWHGWQIAGTPIRKVEVQGFYSSGGYVMMDDLEVKFAGGGSPPTVFCTAGTSTNGCVPAISANNQPSVSQANPCQLSVANVEGQKFGLIFYGIDNTGFTALPWGTGSSSFLCVKPPTQRMIANTSGGTNGQCDGALTQDLNSFLTAFPAALGQPFAVGDEVYAQAWYRDPLAVKTTNLSDAIELTFVP